MPSVHADIVENPDMPIPTVEETVETETVETEIVEQSDSVNVKQSDSVNTGKKLTTASGDFIDASGNIFADALSALTCLFEGRMDCDFYSLSVVSIIVITIFYVIYIFTKRDDYPPPPWAYSRM